MLRFALAQMKAAKWRLLAAGVAILLGTAFITATMLSSDVLRATAEGAARADLRGAQAMSVYGSFPEDYAQKAREVAGVTHVDEEFSTGVNVKGNDGSRYLQISSLPKRGTPPKLSSGSLPTTSDGIVITQDMADGLGVRQGETFTWEAWAYDSDGAEQSLTSSFTVTGIISSSQLMLGQSPGYATKEAVLDLLEKTKQELDASTLRVHMEPGVDVDAVVAEVGKAVGDDGAIRSADDIVDQRVREMTGNADFFVYFGLAFAAVAVIVASMVIANTFEVLVAQRTKTLALARCTGATKGQAAGSVLFEAAVLGMLSSLAGLAVGIGFGMAAAWFMDQAALGVSTIGLTDIQPSTILVPLAVGILMSVVSALGPARAATRVSPVAALRPITVGLGRSGGKVRFWVGAVMSLVGLALLLLPAFAVFAMRDSSDSRFEIIGLFLATGILGGMLTVAGFLVLSVFIVPRVVRWLGALATTVLPSEAAATARLSAANAARNPRRTATTASALVIGVGLVVMMATGAATARATAIDSLGAQFPADMFIMPQSDVGLSDDEVTAATSVPAVTHSAEVWWLASENPHVEPVLATDIEAVNAALNTSPMSVKAGTIAMDKGWWEDLGKPSQLKLTGHGSTMTAPLYVEPIDRLPVPAIIDVASLPKDFDLGQPKTLLLNIDDAEAQKTINAVTEAVSAANPDQPAEIQAPIEAKAQFDRIINAVLAVIIGLLGVAVVIALIGVANTLSLSVIERRREHGVLRAVGVTKPQMRHMLAVEGLLISVAAAVVGIALGLLTGFAGSAILLGLTPTYAFSIDWLVIAGCAIIAVIAGLLASVVPARSALRVPVVVALAAD